MASEDSVWAPVGLHAVVVGCSHLVGELQKGPARIPKQSNYSLCRLCGCLVTDLSPERDWGSGIGTHTRKLALRAIDPARVQALAI